jgi:signal transduction histidine kinase/CheY-like chemotaxis protein/HPt (histidine-containing phosphotransfer) domain-containing protein
MTDDALARMQRRFERERQARLAAEELLENKSRELYTVNQQLHTLVDEREAQVRDRTRELEIARDLAMANSRAKSEFLANMSHEMRTPLNGVLGMLSAAAKVSDKQRLQYLIATAAQSGQLLLALINDLLDVSRFESSVVQLSPAPADLAASLAGVMPPFALEAERRGLEFVCEFAPDFPAQLMVDDLRVKQLVCNLVGNAIKFTHSGFVRIHLRLLADSRIEIGVCDSGIGIAAAQLENIFEPFVQADSSITRNYGGTGLGLAICKKVVDAMGGSVHVSSALGAGSTFCVRLPLEILQPAQMPNCLIHQRDSIRLILLMRGAALSMYLQESLSCLGLSHYQVATEWQQINWQELTVGNDNWVFLDGRLAAEMDTAQLMDLRQSMPRLKLIAVEMPGIESSFPFQVDGYLFHPLILHSLVGCLLGLGVDASEPNAVPAPVFSGQHLLVVDDNEINYQVIASLLTDTGLRLSWAENGACALTVMAQDIPALVLMDIQMPVMDGLTAAQAIRQMAGRAGAVPIVAMTAHAFDEDRDKSIAAGMNEHLTKPVEPEKLFAVLRRYISTSNATAGDSSDGDTSDGDSIAGDSSTVDGAVTPPTEITLSPLTPPPPTSGEAKTASADGSVYLPGFDIAGAMLRTGGNWPLLSKLIIGFAASQEHADTEMAQQLAAGNTEAVRLLAHKIKGTGATLGAARLASAASAIDKQIKDNQLPSVAMMDEFSVALKEVKQGAETLAQTDEPIPAATVELSAATIDEIYAAVEGVEHNFSVNLMQAKRHLARVTTLSAGTPLETFAQQLQHAFDQLRQTELRRLIHNFRAQHAATHTNQQ